VAGLEAELETAGAFLNAAIDGASLIGVPTVGVFAFERAG